MFSTSIDGYNECWIYQKFNLDMLPIGITKIIVDNMKYKHICLELQLIKKLMPSVIDKTW